MDIVVSNSKRCVSVDSINHESTDVVKLKNTENEFTGKFFVQDGNTTKDIDDVFVKGIKIGTDGEVKRPVNGIVTIPPSGGGGKGTLTGVSLRGCEDTRIDAEVDENGIAVLTLYELGVGEISTEKLYVKGIDAGQVLDNINDLKSIQEIKAPVTITELIAKYNELVRKLHQLIP